MTGECDWTRSVRTEVLESSRYKRTPCYSWLTAATNVRLHSARRRAGEEATAIHHGTFHRLPSPSQRSSPSLPSSYTRDPSFTLTPTTCTSLRDYSLLTLHTHSTADKVALTYAAFQRFSSTSLPLTSPLSSSTLPPWHPARPLDIVTVAPASITTVVKGDPDGNRLRMLHALAHIESYAIDLSHDILVRWMDGVSKAELLRDIHEAVGASSSSSPSFPPPLPFLHLFHRFR